jgi:putative iron-dependent peroxidase
MVSSLRCSYLLAVVVAAVLFGVCSAQSQQYHPQPNVLTGLNHQAVGATIYLRPEVWVNASLAQYAQQIAAQFPEIVLSINSQVNGTGLVGGIAFSAYTWQRWGQFLPMPKGLFDFPGYTGPDGWPVMPRTGGELFIHAKASRRDVLYALVTTFVDYLGDAIVDHIDVIEAWQNVLDGENRDLTGYVDGSVNCPPDQKVPQGLIGAEDKYHTNGSFAIAQRWVHNLKAFLAMNGTLQNDVFGRTKKESNELPNPPLTSHMVRVRQSNFGYFLVRQAMPWGDAVRKNAGLFFIAYTKDAHRLDAMCASMVGQGTFATPPGPYDAIMKFSDPVANNFWYFPSMEVLSQLYSQGTCCH